MIHVSISISIFRFSLPSYYKTNVNDEKYNNRELRKEKEGN